MGAVSEKNKLKMERHGKKQTKRFSFPAGKMMGGLGGMLILATVFAVEPSLKNGLVMGPVFWFHKAVFILAVLVLLCEFFSKTVVRTSACRNRIQIMLPDMLLPKYRYPASFKRLLLSCDIACLNKKSVSDTTFFLLSANLSPTTKPVSIVNRRTAIVAINNFAFFILRQ
jgi:hypothetical protein